MLQFSKCFTDRQTLASEFATIVTALATDEPLPERGRDHALIGDWNDHRDCHIKPDLILIYRKPDSQRLQPVAKRLGFDTASSLSETRLHRKIRPQSHQRLAR